MQTGLPDAPTFPPSCIKKPLLLVFLLAQTLNIALFCLFKKQTDKPHQKARRTSKEVTVSVLMCSLTVGSFQ